MGGPSGPMLCGPDFESSGQESVGPEGPPTGELATRCGPGFESSGQESVGPESPPTGGRGAALAPERGAMTNVRADARRSAPIGTTPPHSPMPPFVAAPRARAVSPRRSRAFEPPGAHPPNA
ncbi:DUF6053 domain-containing protein [Lysobacter enzymogenes]|uniref:DUF6053 domain-containing protein n=1 Tax=Lysobacter enzymogenes TaxID=69 RepID=UPI003D189FE6